MVKIIKRKKKAVHKVDSKNKKAELVFNANLQENLKREQGEMFGRSRSSTGCSRLTPKLLFPFHSASMQMQYILSGQNLG